MGIKGLTDRGLAFPEIGAVRKGAKKTDVNRPGSDLKYFRVEFDEREQEAQRIFAAKYGAQPTEINILLPFNEVEKVWDAWYEAYTAGRMVSRSDGERLLYLLDTRTGEVKVLGGEPHMPHPADGIVGYYTDSKGIRQPIKLKPVGRLKIVIPELKRLAYLTVHTTSIHDIINISSQLEAIRVMNGGRIAGIPLVLRRRPKMISTPSQDGSRVRREKWLLSIEADPAWVKAKLLEMKQSALPGNGLALLPEGETDLSSLDLPGMDEDNENETEYVENESIPVPEPEQPVSAGLAYVEPLRYPPERLKERLAEVSNKMLGQTAGQEKRGLVVHCLEATLSFTTDPEASRKSLMKKLTGYASMKDMPDHYVLALYRWLNPSKDSGGDWQAEEMAQREAAAALAYFMPAQESLLNET